MSKILLIVWAINTAFWTSSLQAEECRALLHRQVPNFCVSDRHALNFEGLVEAPLEYSWKVPQGRFHLEFNTCFQGNSGAAVQNDLIIAIDRSQTLALNDSAAGAGQSKQIALAKELLAQLDPDSGVRVSVVLFAKNETCEPWSDGGDFHSQGHFPCRYLALSPLSDTDHKGRLLAMLAAAEKHYANDIKAGSKYEIISKLLDDKTLGISHPSSIVLLSDGMVFNNPHNDEFALFKLNGYQQAQAAAEESFRQAVRERTQVIFGLQDQTLNTFGQIFSQTYDNMCQLSPDIFECQGIDVNDPYKWPVNNIDHVGFAERLVAAAGGSAAEVISVDRLSVEQASLAILRLNASNILSLSGAQLFMNATGKLINLDVSGNTVTALDLPVSSELDLEYRLSTARGEMRVPVRLKLTKATGDVELASQELQCGADAGASTRGKRKFLGGAKCGVVGVQASPLWGLLIFILPLCCLLRRRRFLLGILLLGICLSGSSLYAQDGVNLNQYRPAVGGISTSEQGFTIPAGRVAGGVYFDYAQDLLQVGAEDDDSDTAEAAEGVVSSAMLSHVVLKYGLPHRMALGLHLPVILNQEINRQGDAGESSGSSSHLGDSEIFLKSWLATWGKSYWGLMPFVRLPTGSTGRASGDGQAGYGIQAMASGAKGSLGWAVNLGYLYRSRQSKFSDARVEESLTVKDQVLAKVAMSYRFLPTFTGEMSLQQNSDVGGNVGGTGEGSLLMRYHVSGSSNLHLGSAFGIGSGAGSPEYRIVSGYSYVPGYKTRRTNQRIARAKKPRKRR